MIWRKCLPFSDTSSRPVVLVLDFVVIVVVVVHFFVVFFSLICAPLCPLISACIHIQRVRLYSLDTQPGKYTVHFNYVEAIVCVQ